MSNYTRSKLQMEIVRATVVLVIFVLMFGLACCMSAICKWIDGASAPDELLVPPIQTRAVRHRHVPKRYVY